MQAMRREEEEEEEEEEVFISDTKVPPKEIYQPPQVLPILVYCLLMATARRCITTSRSILLRLSAAPPLEIGRVTR